MAEIIHSSGVDRSQIEEIKQRINIEDVVKRYVSLKPVGKNLFGLCPFHKEDTPSFSVNPELGIYKCFGCGESGDVIEFLMKNENIEFYEALTQLAKEAGVKLKLGKSDPESAKRFLRAKEIHELAGKYYNYILTKHNLGEKARIYLRKRGLTKDSIKTFQIGYAPPTSANNSLHSFLKKKGYQDKELENYGILTKRQGRLTDRFYDRLMFPIFSTSGAVIGFSGRVINKNDKRPKYINSPETLIFQKRRNLFGIFQTKKAINDRDFCILVEGQTDVISSFQAGVKNITAPLGTGVTSDQLDRIKRFTQNIALCFDRDFAGQSAAARVAGLAYKKGFNVSAIELPYGNDADECIKKDKNLWIKAINSKQPAITYFLEKLLSGSDPKSLKFKQLVVKKIFPIISEISDLLIREHHIKEISELTGISESTIKKKIISNTFTTADIEEETKAKDQDLPLEIYLLSLLFQSPKALPWTIEKIPLQELKNPTVSVIVNKLISQFKKDKDFSISSFIEKLDDKERSLCEDSNMRPIWSEEPTQEEIILEITETIRKIKERAIRFEIADLKEQLEKLEKTDSSEKANSVLNLINSKIQELEALQSK
ncbi:DNA primase [Candidatus Dojkabacteria bacterium]|nr:DNA primase [Candidatus Dojkabacteria bacterium]